MLVNNLHITSLVNKALFVFLVVCSNSVVHAGTWRFMPVASIEEVFSDNILLQADNKKSDILTQLRPGLSIRGKGRRIQLNFDYQLQAVFSAHAHSRDELANQLQANSNMELMDKTLFVDVRTTVSQQAATAAGGGTILTANANSVNKKNKTNVTTALIEPYWQHRFGGSSLLEARYGYNEVRNQTDDQSQKSGENTVKLYWRSGPNFRKIPWELNYSKRSADGQTESKRTFEDLFGQASIIFNRKYRLTATIGREHNNDGSGLDQKGDYWRLGGVWTPSKRTNLELGFGKRYFGNDWKLDFRHQIRRFVWTANYSEQVTDARQQQLERELLPLTDAFGNEIENPEVADPLLLPIDLEVSTNNTFTQKSLNTGIDFVTGRSKLHFGLLMSERIQQESSTNTLGINVSWTWRVSAKTNLNIGGNRQDSQEKPAKTTSNLWTTDIGLSYRVAKNADGKLSFQHNQQKADKIKMYAENRIVAGLNLKF